MQPDDPELRRDCEAGGDGAALEARRQPAGIGRVPLGPAGQVLDLLGVGQHALEPLGLQPVQRSLPVVPGSPPSPPRAPASTAASPPAPAPPASWYRSCGSLASAAPDHDLMAPGSSRPARPCRCRCRTPGPGTAARRSPLPRVPHLTSPLWTVNLPRGTARGTGGERKNLTRVLEATMNGPSGNRLPASG